MNGILHRALAHWIPLAATACVVAVAGIFLTMGAPPASADDFAGAQHLVSITKGGLLYDNWYAQLGVDPPENTHPLYPASGKQKGAARRPETR